MSTWTESAIMRKITFHYLPRCPLDDVILKFAPIGFEVVYVGQKLAALIAWKSVNEPHIEYVNATSRDAYEITWEFMQRPYSVPILIKSNENAAKLFHRMTNMSNLRHIGQSENEVIFELR